MKGIILYYSRTGNNKKLAKILKEKLSFSLEEIIDRKRRDGIIGFIISGYDALTKKLTKIEKLNSNIENFEHIVIGTPIWAGNITPAIRTFLLENKDKIRSYSVYSVSEFGEKNLKILDDFEKIIGFKAKSYLFLKDSELEKNIFENKVNKFIDNILK
ncbi:MAG: hypothetical protein QMD25_00545 [Caldisericia bacterium]|jgi:flavodoxin|nr:hypothetical protein [Caldisericia bacterium]